MLRGTDHSFLNFICRMNSNPRFQVNPPFISEIMLGVAVRLEQLLDKSEVKHAGRVASGNGTGAGSSSALAFIVFVPGWTESPMWSKLQSSAHLRACWSISSEGTGCGVAVACLVQFSIHRLAEDALFVLMTLFSRHNTNAMQCPQQPHTRLQTTVSVMAPSISVRIASGRARSTLQFSFCRTKRRQKPGQQATASEWSF